MDDIVLCWALGKATYTSQLFDVPDYPVVFYINVALCGAGCACGWIAKCECMISPAAETVETGAAGLAKGIQILWAHKELFFMIMVHHYPDDLHPLCMNDGDGTEKTLCEPRCVTLRFNENGTSLAVAFVAWRGVCPPTQTILFYNTSTLKVF